MARNGKVHPVISANNDQDYRRECVELKGMNHVRKSRKRTSTASSENWQKVSKEVMAFSRWKGYTRSMRSLAGEKNSSALNNNNRATRVYSRSSSYKEREMNCVLDSDVEDLGNERLSMYDTNAYMKPMPAVNQGEPTHPSIAASRALIIYFAKLAKQSIETEQELDFEFIEGLLGEGADINFTDRHGQSVMHEVARIWHVDVARFVLENGGDVNKTDEFGRTPLHIAASIDYPEMVEFLVTSKADLHAITFGELQTPTHYAAKNDASKALRMLLKLGGRMDDTDYKRRTPLLVAAELDRSETAKYLIDQGAAAGVQDSAGSSVMSFMISKMPPVAKEALDQFHTTDRGNRRQYFYLNHLEPYLPDENGAYVSCARSPLHCVVYYKQMELIMHPVFKRLLDVKWDQFGWRGTIKNIFVHAFFVLVWTALGVTLHFGADSNTDYYKPPRDYIWRIVLESLACCMTLYFICQEFLEISASKKLHRNWKRWRIDELEKDLQFSHPRWPEERKYLEMERNDILDSGISYFNDAWNYFDWVTYGWILGIIVTRIFAVVLASDVARSLHPKVFAIALIFIWLRLMKVFRGFITLGPFIVMIGHIIDDTLKFGFLYFILYVPYVCAFWMTFGGAENAAVMRANGLDGDGWENFNDLMYSVWQLTVVGNYPWDSLLVVDRLMAQILCGTYLAVSAIVMINLFIALMSDTFQRVYDNAKANAAMQRASTILTMEENMGDKTRERYRRLIHERFSPEEMYYDDDSTQPGSGELERMTHQIKDVVDEVFEMLQPMNRNGSGETADKSTKREIERLRSDLAEVSNRHEQTVKEMRNEVAEMKALLIRVLERGSVPSLPSVRSLHDQTQIPERHSPNEARNPSKRSASNRSHRKRHRRKHSFPSDDEVDHGDYQGLPLTDDIGGDANELPSVRVLTTRATARKQQRDEKDHG